MRVVVCRILWLGLFVMGASLLSVSSARASSPQVGPLTLPGWGAAQSGWQRLMRPSLRPGELRPAARHWRLLAASSQADGLGVLQQAQTAPAPPPPAGLNPFSPGSPGFTLLMVDMGLLVGSVVVSIGTSATKRAGGDLTGWKIANIVLNGGALTTSVVMLSLFDMTGLPTIFPILIWTSVGLSAAFLVWEIIQLGIYVNRRSKLEERRMRQGAPPPPKRPGPVVIAPWAAVDANGTPAGGLAVAGQF